MKKAVLIIGLAILGIIGFLHLNKQYALTGLNIPLYSVPNGCVRVDFINNSDEIIKLISISTSDTNIENIKVGERRTVIFKHKGEGAYQFVVIFASEREIIEGDRYIETGYFVTEHIYNNQVKTKY